MKNRVSALKILKASTVPKFKVIRKFNKIRMKIKFFFLWQAGDDE